MVFTQYNPVIEQILRLCLEAPEIECAHAQTLWYTLVRSHPQFQALLKLKAILALSPLSAASNTFDKAADISFLLQPIFLLGVKRIVVCNEEFEEFMTELRRFLLEQMEAPKRKLPPEQYLALINAAAQYCFNTDFIFNRTEAEEKAVERLRGELESGQPARQDPVKTGLYACYEPLYKLKAAKEISLLASLSPIRGIVKTQLDDCFALQEKAEKIPSLTGITDDVSLKVQEQYEEFPYPRWRELRHDPTRNTGNYRLNQAGPDILIAGCGTGQEPLMCAVDYPETSILAVDLSRASLAYATGKAEELGVKNVEFRHADILKLGSLDRAFDGISALGSLVCMKDPVAGWKILTEILKPGGFMRIGLYSASARKAVVTAWGAIRKGNYPNTAAGMRRFRKDSKKLLGDAAHAKIFDAGDYYHLNMYRDLLFHVQEHQHTLPQIKGILQDLNLEFLEMSVSDAARQHYRQYFPADPDGKNLDNWHRMEEGNPDMFRGMYIFWCRKKI